MSTDSSVLPNSSIGGPSASIGEDAYQRPMLPAWEVLEAIPFVLEALLTACAHGRLSSRDLTTGSIKAFLLIIAYSSSMTPC